MDWSVFIGMRDALDNLPRGKQQELQCRAVLQLPGYLQKLMRRLARTRGGD